MIIKNSSRPLPSLDNIEEVINADLLVSQLIKMILNAVNIFTPDLYLK